MHTTVFLHEAILALNVQKGNNYIDATYGEGGHTTEILKLGGNVLAIDADYTQVNKGKKRGHPVVQGLFKQIASISSEHKFSPVHGVLFDFGLSMEQIKNSGKGFSYAKDQESLDMRLGNTGQTAADLLNTLPEKDLVKQMMKYSEEPYALQIARRILSHRRKKDLATVADLKNIINEIVPEEERRNKVYARIFQAVRIMVNQEFDQIKQALTDAYRLLEPGGRIVALTFHSLEDRIVKKFARSQSLGSSQMIDVQKTRPLQSFERSAHLRIIQK